MSSFGGGIVESWRDARVLMAEIHRIFRPPDEAVRDHTCDSRLGWVESRRYGYSGERRTGQSDGKVGVRPGVWC